MKHVHRWPNLLTIFTTFLLADESVLCRGSIIAIDSAVPRRGEPPSSSEDADDRTPTAVSAAAAAAAAHAALLSPAYNTLSVISPTASGKPLRYSGSPRLGVNLGTVLMGRTGTARSELRLPASCLEH